MVMGFNRRYTGPTGGFGLYTARGGPTKENGVAELGWSEHDELKRPVKTPGSGWTIVRERTHRNLTF